VTAKGPDTAVTERTPHALSDSGRWPRQTSSVRQDLGHRDRCFLSQLDLRLGLEVKAEFVEEAPPDGMPSTPCQGW